MNKIHLRTISPLKNFSQEVRDSQYIFPLALNYLNIATHKDVHQSKLFLSHPDLYNEKEYNVFLFANSVKKTFKNQNLNPSQMKTIFSSKDGHEFLDIRYRDPINRLNFTIRRGLLEPMKALLNFIDNIEKMRSAFLFAIRLGHWHLVKAFPMSIMEQNVLDELGKSALHMAVEGTYLGPGCFDDYFKIMNYLVKNNSNINETYSFGTSPLHLAAEFAPLQVVEFLIDQGADVNIQNRFGWTPLYRAAAHNRFDVVKLFLSRGADPSFFIDPINISTWHARYEITHLLLRSVDDLNQLSESLFTALRKGTNDIFEMFLRYGVSVNAQNEQGKTALHYAVREYGEENIGVKLLTLGADVNLQDKDLNTPLHIAAQNASEKWVRLLLKNGAQIDLKNAMGETPMDIALHNGFETLLALMQERDKVSCFIL